jgi:hypothetical protein
MLLFCTYHALLASMGGGFCLETSPIFLQKMVCAEVTVRLFSMLRRLFEQRRLSPHFEWSIAFSRREVDAGRPGRLSIVSAKVVELIGVDE